MLKVVVKSDMYAVADETTRHKRKQGQFILVNNLNTKFWPHLVCIRMRCLDTMLNQVWGKTIKLCAENEEQLLCPGRNFRKPSPAKPDRMLFSLHQTHIKFNLTQLSLKQTRKF